MTLPNQALANRVDPFGSLFATPARGRLLGNRGGRFHDPATRTIRGRPYASRQWICCRLAFKDRRRSVWGKGYTELFFSDEYSALAAGHRPCFECRRADATAFAAAWGRAAGTAPPDAPSMDRALHLERLDRYAKRTHRMPFDTLPNGTMIAQGDRAWLLLNDVIYPWQYEGYGQPERYAGHSYAQVLTPPSIVACLKSGYAPMHKFASKLMVAAPQQEC